MICQSSFGHVVHRTLVIFDSTTVYDDIETEDLYTLTKVRSISEKKTEDMISYRQNSSPPKNKTLMKI